jgi:hypothetical protein
MAVFSLAMVTTGSAAADAVVATSLLIDEGAFDGGSVSPHSKARKSGMDATSTVFICLNGS